MYGEAYVCGRDFRRIFLLELERFEESHDESIYRYLFRGELTDNHLSPRRGDDGETKEKNLVRLIPEKRRGFRCPY